MIDLEMNVWGAIFIFFLPEIDYTKPRMPSLPFEREDHRDVEMTTMVTNISSFSSHIFITCCEYVISKLLNKRENSLPEHNSSWFFTKKLRGFLFVFFWLSNAFLY